jgi:hypothetical protein
MQASGRAKGAPAFQRRLVPLLRPRDIMLIPIRDSGLPELLAYQKFWREDRGFWLKAAIASRKARRQVHAAIHGSEKRR